MTFEADLAAEILGRSAVTPVVHGLGLARRRVLITGAAGSIGRALAVRVAQEAPAHLTLLDINDHGLLDACQDVSAVAPSLSLNERLCDVRDMQRLQRVFEKERPDVVFHAAALKYVHMGERHPGECVLTNLVGARNVVRALKSVGGGRFVLVSTDKAANPSSVMGASKRLAELYVRDLNPAHGVDAVAVRFGNVFGTQGSVALIFASQIASGGPVTITHPDMERYFMLLEEAVGLILLAASTPAGPVRTPILLLEMGDPVRIVDLAERMIAALTPPGAPKPEIAITGLKEGERLSEQLFDEFEVRSPAGIENFWRVDPVATGAGQTLTDADVDDLEAVSRSFSDSVVRTRLFALLDRVLGAPDIAATG